MFELGALVGIFALALNFPKEGSQALEQLTKQAKVRRREALSLRRGARVCPTRPRD